MKKLKKVWKNTAFFIKLSFREAPFQYLTAFLEIVWEVSAPFINLLFPKWIIDELAGGRQWDRVFFYIALWGGVNAGIALLRAAQRILEAPRQARNEERENLYYGRMDSHMDYGRLEDGRVMDEQECIRENLYISYFAHAPLAKLVMAVLKAAGYSYIILTFQPAILAVLVLATIGNMVLASRRQGARRAYRTATAPCRRRLEYLFQALIDLSYAKEVRINSAARWLGERFAAEKEGYFRVYSGNQKKNFSIDTAEDGLAFVQTVLLQGYCALKVLDGSISLGSFSVYLSAFLAVSGAFADVMKVAAELGDISETIDSYREYVAAAVPVHLARGRRSIGPGDRHELEFRNVSFRYPGCDDFVLKDISLKIESGSRLSVVGYNGAGKSTLIKLICRLYEPTEGQILYNGVDIADLRYEEYAERIAVVFQDYNIYYLSIRENASLVSGDADAARIGRALALSGLEERIASLPKGMDTMIGKQFDREAIELSGGEGQKLACARAYLKDSPIVILDEPTASLDPISESRLYERFASIMEGKTGIYISHRLASCRYCDRIIVLADGQIVESGTHGQLMERKGIYQDMYTKQAEHYAEEPCGEAEPGEDIDEINR